MKVPLAQPPLARIDEGACIGCTLCIAACPVDAIVGAAKLMHTVLADRCTGCELCLPPCPVDCIALLPRERPWTPADAARAKSHEQARLARRPDRRAPAARTARPDEEALRSQRQAAVAAALARARARRAAHRRSTPRP
jgi:Na+-translocating ferredoxin:NAD+ oxidoreductase subunit B